MSDCNCNKDQTTADISANAMPCDTTSDKSPVCSCWQYEAHRPFRG